VADRALRDPGGGPGRGRGPDRRLQLPSSALLAGPGLPGGLRAVAGRKGRRVRAGRPLRGPEPEGGGFAAARLQERAAALWPGDAPRKNTGPPLSVKAGCDRGTTASRPAAWHMYTPGPALSAESPAAPGPAKAGRRSLPRPAARRVRCPGAQSHQRTPGERSERVFDSHKERNNYTNPLTVSVHASRGLSAAPNRGSRLSWRRRWCCWSEWRGPGGDWRRATVNLVHITNWAQRPGQTGRPAADRPRRSP
jgi:hypothetical protein